MDRLETFKYINTMNTKALEQSSGILFSSNLLKILIILFMGWGLLRYSAMAQDYGINLPPTQGTSSDGAFMPGVYNWSYTDAQVAGAAAHFNMIRFPINEATANNPASLTQLQGYINQIPGNWAIICMFGTSSNGGQGNGFPNGLSAMGAAWAKINAVFSSYPNVYYEVFNEPFGYAHSTPAECAHYVSDMKTIISDGGLPTSKCILDGLGYADDIIDVAENGWSGTLAYHFYPTWISTPADQTQANYSNLAQASIGSYGPRTFITEFGANLTWANYGYNDPSGCYDTYTTAGNPWSADVNCLRGLDDALRALKADGYGIRGAFCYHGWNNDDSYDYWNPAGANGACKEMEIETHD